MKITFTGPENEVEQFSHAKCASGVPKRQRSTGNFSQKQDWCSDKRSYYDASGNGMGGFLRVSKRKVIS